MHHFPRVVIAGVETLVVVIAERLANPLAKHRHLRRQPHDAAPDRLALRLIDGRCRFVRRGRVGRRNGSGIVVILAVRRHAHFVGIDRRVFVGRGLELGRFGVSRLGNEVQARAFEADEHALFIVVRHGARASPAPSLVADMAKRANAVEIAQAAADNCR